MDEKFLYDYVCCRKRKNICEITAVKNGRIAFEGYWNGYVKGDALNVMSVTKSIMALLTGIAIDKGFIKSVDQKVVDFFPGYRIKRGEKTICKAG